MRIIIVLVGDVNKFPPTISLLNALEELGNETVFISTQSIYKKNYKNVVVDKIDVNYEKISNPVQKMLLIPKLGNELWNKINKYYTNDSVIWVVTDVTLKYLGYRLIGKNYILQFLELSDRLVYYKKIPSIKLNEKKLCDNALKVIVPEYNRAHILQAIWNLNSLPFVISNCPYGYDEIKKNNYIDDQIAKETLEKIGKRKIILYQGVISKERPLEPLILAVSDLGDDYAFVVMSGGKNIYQDVKSKNYYFIPFVSPPNHLQITSHAYIGVLSYVPTNSTGYSVLNTLYCAPNKVFEFTKFGIPMIGNDIPGLRNLFESKRIGKVFENWTQDSIQKAIIDIEKEYSTYSKNANQFYESSSVLNQIRELLNSL